MILLKQVSDIISLGGMEYESLRVLALKVNDRRKKTYKRFDGICGNMNLNFS